MPTGGAFRITTSSSGSFSVTVPKGMYTLRARQFPCHQDGSQDCRPRTGALTVQVGATTSVVVVSEGNDQGRLRAVIAYPGRPSLGTFVDAGLLHGHHLRSLFE